jgi:hypothetical protein
MSTKSLLRIPFVTTSFATLALLAAACATEATDPPSDDSDVATTAEALGRVGVGDDDPLAPPGHGGIHPIDPGGPITPAGLIFNQTPPRVMSRTATGSSIVANFDRVVTAAELPMAALHVDVLRRNGTTFDKLNVLGSASLAPDGRSLTMNLTEPLRSGTAYYTRGQWKRCRKIPIINATTCKTFRAEFGEVVVSRSKPAIVNGIFATELTAAKAAPFFFRAANVGAPQVEKVVVDEPLPIAAAVPAPAAAAAPGTFRVKSMTPIELSQENTRDLRTVVVEFEGGAALPERRESQRDRSFDPLESRLRCGKRVRDLAVLVA